MVIGKTRARSVFWSYYFWMRAPLRLLPFLLIATLLGACATLQQVLALRQVAFALESVGAGRLAGVPLARIGAYRDLTALEVTQLALALGRGTAPLDFTVGLRASNPESNGTAKLVKLDWLLLLDGRETIRGVIDSSYTLPAGQPVTIPIRIQLDLKQFFDGGIEEMVGLASGLVGARSDPTRITLELQPQIDTPLGPLSTPAPIRVSGRTGG